MSTNIKVVNIVGDLNISTVEGFAEQIRQSIAEKPMVLISLSQTSDIDLAGIQLLYASRRYAEKQDKAIHISGAIPETVARRLYHGGFTPTIIREGRALETEMAGFLKRTVPDA